MTLQVSSVNVSSGQGVAISVTGIAQVKIYLSIHLSYMYISSLVRVCKFCHGIAQDCIHLSIYIYQSIYHLGYIYLFASLFLYLGEDPGTERGDVAGGL